MSAGELQPNRSVRFADWAFPFLALLICFAAITRQSLWNDEALTAVKAMQPTLDGWWHEMMADRASDLQMPLYMIYLWGFAKVFGTSEWLLRAANIPFFVVGLPAFLRAMPAGKKTGFAIVALLSPFAWYYIGEARPYGMQLGASLMIVGALSALSDVSRRRREESSSEKSRDASRRLLQNKEVRLWLALFLFGIVVLSGSSLLGMIWAGTACLAAIWILGWKTVFKLARAHMLIFSLSFCALMALAGYYLWTLKIGARASDVGRTDARNLVFIPYELLGLGGLGPGRLEIREQGLRAFVPFAKWLFIYGVLISDLLILGSWRIYREQPRAKLMGLIGIIALPVVFILGTGYVKEFRVLGRHFTPLLAVILLELGTGLHARWIRPHWASKPMAIAFIIFSVASCLSFRFALRHERDDYRDAAFVAKWALQTGRGVWWNAGREGAVYYGLPLAVSARQKNTALWLMNPTAGMLPTTNPPEIIVTSRPDVYDARGAVALYLADRKYFPLAAVPAFVVWERKLEGVKVAGRFGARTACPRVSPLMDFAIKILTRLEFSQPAPSPQPSPPVGRGRRVAAIPCGWGSFEPPEVCLSQRIEA